MPEQLMEVTGAGTSTHILMLVCSEAQRAEQAVCAEPDALCEYVHDERLVHPAQGLPQMCHELHIWVSPRLERHPKLLLVPVYVRRYHYVLLRTHGQGHCENLLQCTMRRSYVLVSAAVVAHSLSGTFPATVCIPQELSM